MSLMGVKIVSNDEKALAGFAKLQTRVRYAIQNGLKEGGNKVRTHVRRAMKEQTSLVQLKSVTKREFTIYPSTSIDHSGSLAYSIIYKGKPATKAQEFKATGRRGPGGGVTIIMWQKAHKFQRSFMIAGRSGTSAMRARLGAERLPIRSFDGPNLAKEAAKENGQVAMTFLFQANHLVPPVIEKYLARL